MQGLAIGTAFILPGLSAGTVILLLGFYRPFIDDLSRARLKPYFPHLLGGIVAVLGGVKVIGYLMEHFYNLLMAFLLGMLVVSVKVVLSYRGGAAVRPVPLVMGAAGFFTAWLVCEPAGGPTLLPPGSWFHFFLGGTVSSATMLLPGISGSAVLIIMNLYDDAIMALNQLQWLNLAFFSGGAALGLFALARLLSALYRRYRAEMVFLLAGLILGSTRALLPSQITAGAVLAALAGGLLAALFASRRTPGRL